MASELTEILRKYGNYLLDNPFPGEEQLRLEEAEQAIEAYIQKRVRKAQDIAIDDQFKVLEKQYTQRFEQAIGEDEEDPFGDQYYIGRNELRAEARKRWQDG